MHNYCTGAITSNERSKVAKPHSRVTTQRWDNIGCHFKGYTEDAMDYHDD